MAGLPPELERPGLLPKDSPHLPWPVDVCLPRFSASAPAALKLAITSGVRDHIMLASAHDTNTALHRFEDFKCSYNNIQALCQDQGIRLVPMILEVTGGGWGKGARKVWPRLAKAS